VGHPRQPVFIKVFQRRLSHRSSLLVPGQLSPTGSPLEPQWLARSPGAGVLARMLPAQKRGPRRLKGIRECRSSTDWAHRGWRWGRATANGPRSAPGKARKGTPVRPLDRTPPSPLARHLPDRHLESRSRFHGTSSRISSEPKRCPCCTLSSRTDLHRLVQSQVLCVARSVAAGGIDVGKLSDLKIRALVRAGSTAAVADGGGLTFTLSSKGTASWVPAGEPPRRRAGQSRHQLLPCSRKYVSGTGLQP
jgi:hypothetical protein